MKFLHLSDLHLGKRLRGFSLLEDQRHFLFEETIPLLKEEKIDVLVIAGDIYDVPAPSQDAVVLLDDFITTCANEHIKVLMIPGNHDSSLRLSYGSKIFRDRGIYIVTDIKDSLKPIEIERYRFYLLPFMKHHDVNAAFGTEFKDYNSAAAFMVEQMNLDRGYINILVAHQLVIPFHGDPEFAGSEEVVVGTIGNINCSTFSKFDYVALGHIHKPQKIGDNIFYCGSPLRYHVDEARQEKSFFIVSVQKERAEITHKPIHVLHELRIVEGEYADVIAMPKSEDYVFVNLLDKAYIENAIDALRQTVFPRCLGLGYPNIATNESDEEATPEFDSEHPEELFPKFYEMVLGQDLSQFQSDTVLELLEKAREGRE